jgi:hypothetical protein
VDYQQLLRATPPDEFGSKASEQCIADYLSVVNAAPSDIVIVDPGNHFNYVSTSPGRSASLRARGSLVCSVSGFGRDLASRSAKTAVVVDIPVLVGMTTIADT